VTLGEKIKFVRWITKGITQTKLSQMVNVTSVAIHNYENDKSMPSLPVFVAICDALNVSPNEMLQGVEL